MKRLFLIVLGLSICLFLASCSVSETNERSIDESNANQTADDNLNKNQTADDNLNKNQTANNTISDNTNSMPSANIMYFDSFQHMAQLKEYIEKADDPKSLTHDEYITKNYRGGISYTAGVSKMFADLDGLNVLHLESSSGYNLNNLVYDGAHGKLEYVYVNKDKKIRIKCYYDSDGTVATKFAYRKKYDVADRIGFGDEEIILYYASKEVVYSFCSCITTSNSLIDVWFYDDDISAAKEVIEKYAISTTLNELIAQ